MIQLTVALWVGLAAAPIQLAAPGLSVVNMDEKLGSFYTEHLAQKLAVEGLRVVTAREISTLVGLERQRQLLACGEQESSCLAELAGALGVDGVIVGDIARIGAVYQLNVRVIAAQDARPLSIFSAQVTKEEELLAQLALAAKQFAAELLPRPPEGKQVVAPEPSVSATAPSTSRLYAWVPAAVGVGGAAVSAYFVVQASDRHHRLTDLDAEAIDSPTAETLADQGRFAQTAGVVSGVGAAVAFGVSAWLFFGSTQSPAVSVAVGQTSATVSVQGRFP